MLRGGRVVPRSTLRIKLRVSDAELDGHMRRLRQRMEGIEGWRRITSLRGVGFALEPASAGSRATRPAGTFTSIQAVDEVGRARSEEKASASLRSAIDNQSSPAVRIADRGAQ
jgi:hypothetical protein